ncbi:MAG: hypothetical protein ACKOC1_04155, partial [Hyphomicrobiales bacterium]
PDGTIPRDRVLFAVKSAFPTLEIMNTKAPLSVTRGLYFFDLFPSKQHILTSLTLPPPHA